jgi:hypothetical protein
MFISAMIRHFFLANSGSRGFFAADCASITEQQA